MAEIGIKGSLCSGHGGFPPRPSVEGDAFFTVNGIAVMTDGALFPDHSDGHSSHSGTAVSSRPWFTINGKPVVCNGDVVSCGSVIITGDGLIQVS